MKTIFALILLFTFAAEANDLPVPPSKGAPTAKKLSPEERAEIMAEKIKTGALVKVVSYDTKAKTFTVQIVKEPDVGPNIATFGNLKRAMGEPTTARKIGNPQDLVGKEMTLVEDLILVPEASLPSDIPVTPSKKRK